MEPLNPPPDAHHLKADGGEIFLWEPRAGVVMENISGIVSLPIMRFITDDQEGVIARCGSVTSFFDLEHVSHYTREARELATAFGSSHRDRIRAVHAFVASKLVALGLGAFRHSVVGFPVWAYADRASFLRSFEEALRAA